MGTIIANTDLSAAVVGTTGVIDWHAVDVPQPIQQYASGHMPSLVIFNESGCGLLLVFRSSKVQLFIAAGAWRKITLDTGITGDQIADYSVQYVLPNAPVSKLIVEYYDANESPDDVGILGNSPIGIAGNVQTSNIQSLKNDGNPAPTSIIEATPSDQTSSSVSDNNDGSGFRQILSANVLRKIYNFVRGNSGATKASIVFGDSGDASITTLYGSVQGGQPANVGALTAGASTVGALTGTGANSLDGGNITTDGAGNVSKVGNVTHASNTDEVFLLNTTAGNKVFLEASDSHSAADWMLIVTTLGDIVLWDNHNARTIWEGSLSQGRLILPSDIEIDGVQYFANAAPRVRLDNTSNIPPTGPAAYLGRGPIVGTESDVVLTSLGRNIAMITDASNDFFIKSNNYFDGTNDRYCTGAPAFQVKFDNTGTARRIDSGSTQVAGGIITWGVWRPLGFHFIPSGVQDQGHFGLGMTGCCGGNMYVGFSFHGKLTNVPTSITTTADSSGGGALSLPIVRVEGFEAHLTINNGQENFWDGLYETVGN